MNETRAYRCGYCRGQLALSTEVDARGNQHEEIRCLLCCRTILSSLPYRTFFERYADLDRAKGA
jgi:hypothetical protein